MENNFNLEEILEKAPEAEPCLHWVRMRFTENKNHIAIYKSGKVLVSGTKSDEELNNLVNNLIIYFNKCGIINKVLKIKVNNYVITSTIGQNVDLNDLAIKLLDYDISYEPEQFPALRFKDKYNITYLLFSTGKITITGVKSLDNIENQVKEFKDLIYENI